MLKNIIAEDKHIIVVYKPAGIATQTARVGQQDMVSELKNYLAKKPEYKGKGEPYLGIVHRLDQPVSGLLVFARTKQAAARLSKQAADGRMQKFYYAVVCGRPDKEQGRLEDYLYKDSRMNQSLIVDETFPGAKKAVLHYKLVKTLVMLEENLSPGENGGFSGENEISLLEIRLVTGRHHQIRAQMSHAGIPLLGDSKYGSPRSKELGYKAGCKSAALCAFRLIFDHPAAGERMTFEKQPEGEIFLPFFTRGI
ncbi:MAG: RluA family pseudouridine synthase [Lachnospiraceae bacterium]|nr:RluA family pseudouridine synthase [Lachnospiraceae bacterium]MDE7331460.1 RluA family pseudouridine synthase [Lachnospiraceae bacterium]